MFGQILINGIIAGAIYALVAAGFSLIYSTCKFVHFAHGSVVILAGYLLYWLYSIIGMNFALSVILVLVLSAGIGYGLNAFLYSPLRSRKASPSVLLIASVALMILIESLIQIFFGSDVKTIGLFHSARGIAIGDSLITPLQIVVVSVSIVLFGVLLFLMYKTKLGKAMRAVADNKEVAEIVGISSEKIYGRSFMMGSVVAGVAGILIALEYNLEPTMGASLMVKGFAAAIVGGIGSVPGAVLGSFLLGLVENFGIWSLPSGYKDAIAFTLLFTFLLFRPNGIFAVKKGIDK